MLVIRGPRFQRWTADNYEARRRVVSTQSALDQLGRQRMTCWHKALSLRLHSAYISCRDYGRRPLPWQLTASAALAKIQSAELTVEAYTRSLIERIEQRDDDVRAWVRLEKDRVIQLAIALDQVPRAERGPLHGLPIAVKDVIYTKDMPTAHNSPLYGGSFPKVDAASVTILRQAGALIFGKTTTTEFAATGVGPETRNPHDLARTPGGSSTGSAAATGGSTIRPGSFNGIYAFKPTCGAISREGQKLYAPSFDTLGMFTRCVDDLILLTGVFAVEDDKESQFRGVEGERFAICKTMAWGHAGEGTIAALDYAVELLEANGAIVEELDLGPEFASLPEWYDIMLSREGGTTFLSEQRVGKEKLHPTLVSHVDNSDRVSHEAYLEAFDGIAALGPRMDEIAGRYAAFLTPSVSINSVSLPLGPSTIPRRMIGATYFPPVCLARRLLELGKG
ncbi:amidase signature domain-containing protein [Ilyonectria destructans]|nr:amidase signature domain-containing protein [Ilyonectria destructans]